MGAGPGTALCAAVECWPALADALLVDASPIFRAFGEQLAAEMQQPHMTWRTCDVAVDEIDEHKFHDIRDTADDARQGREPGQASCVCGADSAWDHGKDSDRALVAAARGNSRESYLGTVRFLLERGADVNKPGARSETALIAAARHKDPTTVQLLLQHHADVNLKDVDGNKI